MPIGKAVELNEPSAPRDLDALRQHLINASNELYLHELRSTQAGRAVPDSLKRAHASVKAELRRLEVEIGVTR
jgi:hypothetical protein